MRKKICSRCGAIADKSHVCDNRKRMEVKRERKYVKKDISEVKETHRVLNTYRWQKKREYIKRRDNYYCQRCWHKLGKITSTNLEVHHIKNRHDYPELIFDSDNLITMCGDCNKFYIGKNELDFEWKRSE